MNPTHPGNEPDPDDMSTDPELPEPGVGGAADYPESTSPDRGSSAPRD
jgi:hypothetical protein